MATQAPSRASAVSMELSSLSQASAKAAEQLTSVLRTTEVALHHDPAACTLATITRSLAG